MSLGVHWLVVSGRQCGNRNSIPFFGARYQWFSITGKGLATWLIAVLCFIPMLLFAVIFQLWSTAMCTSNEAFSKINIAFLAVGWERAKEPGVSIFMFFDASDFDIYVSTAGAYQSALNYLCYVQSFGVLCFSIPAFLQSDVYLFMYLRIYYQCNYIHMLWHSYMNWYFHPYICFSICPYMFHMHLHLRECIYIHNI